MRLPHVANFLPRLGDFFFIAVVVIQLYFARARERKRERERVIVMIMGGVNCVLHDNERACNAHTERCEC